MYVLNLIRFCPTSVVNKMISVFVRTVRSTALGNRFLFVGSHLARNGLANTVRYSVAADIAGNRSSRRDPVTTSSVLDEIKSNAASRERVRYDTFKDFVESLNEPITTENISFLYQCIGWYLPHVSPAEKAELIGQLWTKVKQWKSPSQEDFVSWIRALRESETDIAWEQLKAELDTFEPALKVYEELLYLVSSRGRSEQSVEILARIKQQDFPLTEKIFNALIVAHSLDKNVQAFESVLELMASANLTPNTETQFEMARAYTNNELWDSAREIIDLADFNTRQILDLLKTVLDKRVDGGTDYRVATLVQKLPSEVLKNRDISPVIRNFMTEQIHIHNRPNDVLRILKCLPKPTMVVAENEDYYGGFLLHELLATNQPFPVIKAFCDFLAEDGRNPRAAFACTEMAMRLQSPHSLDLLRLLATKEPLKPHYFWPLFIVEYQNNGEQGVVDLIAEMKALNVSVDVDTINSYVLPRVALLLKDVKSGVRLITEAGIEMSTMMSPLLLHLLSNSRYEDFHHVLSTYPNKINGDQLIAPLAKYITVKTAPKDVLRILKSLMDRSKLPQSTDLNGSLLMELGNIGKFVPLQALVNELNRHKIKLSRSAISRVEERIKTAKNLTPDLRAAILAALSKVPVEDGSAPLSSPAYLESKHPRDMNFDELEAHLAELEGKQLNTRGILRKLLQMAIKEKRYEKALKLKTKCDESKMDYSAGMLASCIELYTRFDQVDEAKATWEELEKKFPNFVIDEFKAIDLATFLISKGQQAEAKQLLQRRAKQKVYGENNNKNCWRLLNMICELSAAEGSKTLKTKSFLDFLIKHKYCRYSNTLLGPVVRECLLKKDLRGAVGEFKDIAKRHRKTPLNLELMTILVGIKNGQPGEYGAFEEAEVMEMINDVFKAVEEVHGVGAAKTSLLFATAEAGTDKQVRKILLDPNVRIDPQGLQRQCEYLGKAGKTEPLIRLIKSSRGLSHTIINENQLWCALMQTLANQNQIEEAVRLFDRLLEEDEFKVNKQIAGIVIDLLRRNNLELGSRFQAFINE